MKQNIIKRLSDRDHLLAKPAMYIGGTNNIIAERLLIIDGKLEFREIEFNPGLWKIIDEIFANAIDEGIRTNFKFSNNITVTMSRDQIIVSDNGRGLPQDLMDDGTPMGVVAFTEARAGTNFSEETKADASIGTNGVGSFATNVFSSEFIVDTYNGKSGLHLICRNNMETVDFQVKKSTTSNGTTVKFKPDLQRFGLVEINEIYPLLMSNYMMHLSQVFPIKFTLVDNIGSTDISSFF